MRLLKVGIAAFAVILGVGIVGTGASLGKLYKTSQLTYKTSLEEALDATALKNIYVSTDVPLRIETTTGTPMVTFESNETGLIIPEPKYELKVRTQGDSSYIDIINDNHQFMDFSFDRGRHEAVVYLPEQAIGKLKIDGHPFNRVEYAAKVDINELIIDGGSVELGLEGNIGKVDLDVNRVALDMVSHTPATVEVNANSGDVVLAGSYKDVTINELSNGEIKVDSNTPYKVAINGAAEVVLKGAIEAAEVSKNDYGKVTIQATTQPKYLQVDSYYSDVRIQLPSDLSGFTSIYEYEYEEQSFFSNFDLSSQKIGETTKKLTYGDGATQIVLNVRDADTSIMK